MNTSDVSIKFINHACIQIFTKDYSVLVDPWFEDKVFNNSWCLFKETDIDSLDLTKLKYIFISHEHPDHLHFPTLKTIYGLKQDVEIIFPHRKDTTVKKVIEKIGFKFHFIKQNSQKFFLDKNNYCKYFGDISEGDHTIAFSINGKKIINQNDDYTKEKTVNLINKEFGPADLLFTQFSLAGYYGNSDNPKIIQKNGHDFHLERVKYYKSIFNVKFVVPFASYVYFCKNTNRYLNNFIVRPDEILNLLGSDICQLVYFNDEVYFDDKFIKRNLANLNKLQSLFENKNLQFFESQNVSVEKIIKTINEKMYEMSFLKKIKAFTENLSLHKIFSGFYKYLKLSKPLNIQLTDTNQIIEIDFKKNSSKLSNNISSRIDFKIPSEELLYMFQYPWGSDTANITATVNYYSKRSFYFFEYLLKYYHINGAKLF